MLAGVLAGVLSGPHYPRQASTRTRGGGYRAGISSSGLAGTEVALEHQDRREDREHQRQLTPATPLDRGSHDDEHEEQREDRSGEDDEGPQRAWPLGRTHRAEGGSGSVAPSRFGARPDRRRFTQTSGS